MALCAWKIHNTPYNILLFKLFIHVEKQMNDFILSHTAIWAGQCGKYLHTTMRESLKQIKMWSLLIASSP